MVTESKEFVLKSDVELMTTEGANGIIIEKERIIYDKNDSIQVLEKTINNLRKTIMKISETDDTESDEEDEIGSGIIYFVEDKDVTDRGKIGRTKNTDIKKLKARYTTFASPNILCYYSADIKTDENALKKLMRAAGCMRSNTEKLSNCAVASQIFYDFARRM
jgi:hypothetical protein